jgi:hypothetical protein
MEALGRLFDVAMVAPPAATNGAVTGVPVSLENASGCTFLIIGGVASAGDDVQFDLQEIDGAAGTPQDLDIVDHCYYKSAVTMDNTETWTKFTQTTAASEVDLGDASTTDIQQNIVAVYVGAEDLSDGYTHVTLNIPDLGAGDKTLTCIAILHDLYVKRTPSNLAAVN